MPSLGLGALEKVFGTHVFKDLDLEHVHGTVGIAVTVVLANTENFLLWCNIGANHWKQFDI